MGKTGVEPGKRCVCLILLCRRPAPLSSVESVLRVPTRRMCCVAPFPVTRPTLPSLFPGNDDTYILFFQRPVQRRRGNGEEPVSVNLILRRVAVRYRMILVGGLLRRKRLSVRNRIILCPTPPVLRVSHITRRHPRYLALSPQTFSPLTDYPCLVAGAVPIPPVRRSAARLVA